MINLEIRSSDKYLQVREGLFTGYDLDIIAAFILEGTKSRTPIRSGVTYDETVINKPNDNVRIIEGKTARTKAVISYLHYGTKAHGPVTAKVLTWIDYDTGQRIFAKWVKGIRASYYFEPTNADMQNIDNFIKTINILK